VAAFPAAATALIKRKKCGPAFNQNIIPNVSCSLAAFSPSFLQISAFSSVRHFNRHHRNLTLFDILSFSYQYSIKLLIKVAL